VSVKHRDDAIGGCHGNELSSVSTLYERYVRPDVKPAAGSICNPPLASAEVVDCARTDSICKRELSHWQRLLSSNHSKVLVQRYRMASTQFRAVSLFYDSYSSGSGTGSTQPREDK
jgi:hypothetical protein